MPRQKSATPGVPRSHFLRYAGREGEIPSPQRSVYVRCRAEVIIAHAPSTLYTCETHVTYRRGVYCPPSPLALPSPSSSVARPASDSCSYRPATTLFSTPFYPPPF